MSALYALVERDIVPDFILRLGIRFFCRLRLIEEKRANRGEALGKQAFVRSLREALVAEVPEKANEQHYEVPPELYLKALGTRLKYSSCYYQSPADTLDSAEEKMLSLTTERAHLEGGQRVLELGCGWGSLTLWIAERFPSCHITGVSNSASQRAFISARARERGLSNVEIITADMNAFEAPGLFDRVVSVEMFEHMRNWPELFRRVSSWLTPEGKFFMHVFAHRTYAYPYVDDGGDGDWMARYFFSGGMMPSDDLALHFQEHLLLEDHWWMDGTHYSYTARDWLKNFDSAREEIFKVFTGIYGAGEELRWIVRWRLFFMACEEMWGYARGKEWGVSHYRFKNR